MSAENTDMEYLTPDSSQTTEGKSPLVMLQEICKNIGSDVSTTPHTTQRKPASPGATKASPRQQITSARHGQSPMQKSVKSHSPKARRTPTHTPPTHNYKPTSHSLSSSCSTASSAITPTSMAASALSSMDMHSQLTAHYHLLYQKMLYQNELERIKLSVSPPAAAPLTPPQTGSAASLMSALNLLYGMASTPPSSALSLPNTTASSNPMAADFCRLSAMFQDRFGQSALESLQPRLSHHYTDHVPSLSALNATESNSKLPQRQPMRCNWVTADGFCGKSFYSDEDLMSHIRSHVVNAADSSVTNMLPGSCPQDDYCSQKSYHNAKSGLVNNPLSSYRFLPYTLNHKQTPALFL